MNPFALGALPAAGLALLAWRARLLTVGGASAAILVGAVIFGIAGWRGALVLFAFFIPAVLLSRIGGARKRKLLDIGKHGARDAWQVLANGGVATLALFATPSHALAAFAAFAGALSAAGADTWGTEIGVLAARAPRSILSGKRQARGLSGGVTSIGTLAELAGACVVAATAAVLGVATFIPVVLGGWSGALVDSVLGATLQERRFCGACQSECETNPHYCGRATVIIRGIRGFGNDAVNAAATLTGAVVALLFAVFLT